MRIPIRRAVIITVSSLFIGLLYQYSRQEAVSLPNPASPTAPPRRSPVQPPRSHVTTPPQDSNVDAALPEPPRQHNQPTDVDPLNPPPSLSAEPDIGQPQVQPRTDAILDGPAQITEMLSWNEFELTSAQVMELRRFAATENSRQYVYNGDVFSGDAVELVIVVQVHQRLDYLTVLLESLRVVHGIENVLLVISTDFWSPAFEKLINTIEFCRTIRILFPHSKQMFPKEFPGDDPNDCPRDISREEATAKNCNNFATPDRYGHYRESKFAATKHHWWFKAQFVFEKIIMLKTSTAPVIFLEEDHFASPDLVVAAKALIRLRNNECPQCEIMTLGVYDQLGASSARNSVHTSLWKSSDHNMGMMFDRTFWTRLKACNNQFCTFDDYNWDWTLQYMGESCFKEPIRVIVVDSPRVFHVGKCGGMHHHDVDCKLEESVAPVRDFLRVREKSILDAMKAGWTMRRTPPSLGSRVTPNGGWGDPRDHRLCLTYLTS